ncbi:MAG: FKBP-type peptidyl-prolyl cis-trans isomerase [Thermoflexales bacterium]|nr:FKBP-type peptidyl-prolyl cis-trans isomerase [Thermoflexales bacterium]
MKVSERNAWIVISVLVAAGLVLFALSFVGRNASPAAAAPAPAAVPTTGPARPAATTAAKPPATAEGSVTTASGLSYIDTKVGTGARPQKGQTVVVHYTGYLDNGTVFDSSRQRNQPFEFALGTGAVIKGWDEGIATMNVGGIRKLIIPPALAYGAAGAGGGRIPPNARLTFDVELLSIK